MSTECYDVAVIGGGPAGIAAVNELLNYPLSILLVDENRTIGGQLWRTQTLKKRAENQSKSSEPLLKMVLMEKMKQSSNLKVLMGAAVLGVFPTNQLLISLESGELQHISAKSIIFATGAREKVLPFKGWTLPGVMTLGAAQILLKNQGVIPSSSILVAGAGPLPYLLAGQILSYGGDVDAMLDRSTIKSTVSGFRFFLDQLPKVTQAISALGKIGMNRVPLKFCTQVVEAKGNDSLEEVIVAKIKSDGTILPGSKTHYKTKTLVCGEGFVSNIELPQQAGCKLRYAIEKGGWYVNVDDRMATSLPDVYAAGEITGVGGGEKGIIEGNIAALSVLNSINLLKNLSYKKRLGRLIKKRRRFLQLGKFLNRLWAIPPKMWDTIGNDSIICRCEDITMAEIRQSINNGFVTSNALKKATRCSMGNCQGRTCGSVIYDILLAHNQLETANKLSPFSIRAPVKPISFEMLAKL
jgi:D-hydroxyproline dehydrogenase subunit alpha